jgi:hypothetical protein
MAATGIERGTSGGDVGRRLTEVWRVRKLGGLYQQTMLPKRDAQFGHGPAIAADTLIRGRGPRVLL